MNVTYKSLICLKKMQNKKIGPKRFLTCIFPVAAQPIYLRLRRTFEFFIMKEIAIHLSDGLQFF
jgi:hypothetical protein